MKVYTKTGDTGTTALFGGTRVPKHHIRIESYGTVDELNSHIGLIRDQDINVLYKNVLIEVQDRLFTVGAILATPPEKEVLKNLRNNKPGAIKGTEERKYFDVKDEPQFLDFEEDE